MHSKTIPYFPVASSAGPFPVLNLLFCLFALSLFHSSAGNNFVQDNTIYDFFDTDLNPIGPLNYLDGTWFMFSNTNVPNASPYEAFDGRILEFHAPYEGYVTSKSFGSPDDESFPQQAYLRKPSMVIIFYPEQFPTIGKSLAINPDFPNMNHHPVNVIQVSEYLAKLLLSYKKIKFVMNLSPFTYRTGDMPKFKMHLLIDFPELFRTRMDLGKDSSLIQAELSTNYDSNRNEFNKGVLHMLLDYTVNNNVNAFSEPSGTKIDDVLLNEVMAGLTDEPKYKLKSLFESVQYFALKLTRDFFFISKHFINNLFKDFDPLNPDKKTFSPLFQANIVDNGPGVILRADLINDLKFENFETKLLDYQTWMNSNSVQENGDGFIQKKINQLIERANDVYLEVLDLMKSKFPNGTYPDNLDLIVDGINAKVLLALFGDLYYPEILASFLDKVKVKFSKMEEFPLVVAKTDNYISANDVYDLDNELQFHRLRVAFLTMGELNWNSELNNFKRFANDPKYKNVRPALAFFRDDLFRIPQSKRRTLEAISLI